MNEAKTDPETVVQAANAFVDIAIGQLADDNGVHAETIIAGVARMAGTFLFRSFGFHMADAQPGQAVLSDAANEHGPRLVDILSTVLADAGIQVDLGTVDDVARSSHQPLRKFLDTQSLLEPAFDRERSALGLDPRAAADAAALATALLIQQCREVLDANVAFDIAVFGMIEGAKTHPAALK